MALPDYIEQKLGTSIIWGDSGGTSPTVGYALTASNLLNGVARNGTKADLGADWSQEYLVTLVVDLGTAPTSGGTVDLWLPCSIDDTLWPTGLNLTSGSPTDGAFTLNTDLNLRNLGGPVSVYVATGAATQVTVVQPVIWRPRGRYVAPVIDNNMSQALRNLSPSGTRVILTPLRSVIND
jgi:hypothetical protein